MMSRREVMAAATAAAAAAPASGLCAVPSAAPRTVGDGASLYTVVYDDRFPESVSFAEQARHQGYRVSPISGDVTALWYDDLYHRWKKGPAAIAGLTTADAAMCLGMFAADAGLRCVFEGEHGPADAAKTIEHRVRAPAGWPQVKVLEACGDRWPQVMPRLMGTCPIAPARQRIALTATVPARAGNDRPILVSWVFAPIPRS